MRAAIASALVVAACIPSFPARSLRIGESDSSLASETCPLDYNAVSDNPFRSSFVSSSMEWIEHAWALGAATVKSEGPFVPDVCLLFNFQRIIATKPNGIVFSAMSKHYRSLEAFASTLSVATPLNCSPSPHLVVGVATPPPRPRHESNASDPGTAPDPGPAPTFVPLLGAPSLAVEANASADAEALLSALRGLQSFAAAEKAGTPVLFVGVGRAGAVAELAALNLASLRGSGRGIQAMAWDAPPVLRRVGGGGGGGARASTEWDECSAAPMPSPLSEVHVAHIMRVDAGSPPLEGRTPTGCSSPAQALAEYPTARPLVVAPAVLRYSTLPTRLPPYRGVPKVASGVDLWRCADAGLGAFQSRQTMKRVSPAEGMEAMFDAINAYREKLGSDEVRRGPSAEEAGMQAEPAVVRPEAEEEAAVAAAQAAEAKRAEAEAEAAKRERRAALDAARAGRDGRVEARERAEAAAARTLGGRQALGATGTAVGSGKPAPALRNRLITDSYAAGLGRRALPNGRAGARSGLETGAGGRPVWRETGALAGHGEGEASMSVADAARILADRDDRAALRALRLAEEGFTPHRPLELPASVRAALHPAEYAEETVVVGGEETRTVGVLDLPGYLNHAPGSFERTVTEAQHASEEAARALGNGLDPAALAPVQRAAVPDALDGIRIDEPLPMRERRRRAAESRAALLNPAEAARQRSEKVEADRALGAAPGSGGRGAVPGSGAW